MKINIFVISLFVLTYIIGSSILKLNGYVMLLIYLSYPIIAFFVLRKDVYAIVGNVALSSGNNEKAVKYLEKAVFMKTRSPVAHLNLAIIKLREGDWSKSLEYLDLADGLNTNIINDKNIMLTRGSSYWIKGDIKKSIEVLEALKDKYEYVNPQVLTTLSYMYFLDEKYDEAILISEQAIEDTQETPGAWDNLGQVYLKLNNIDKAIECFEKALEYRSTLVDSLFFLGSIYESKNDLEKAKEYFDLAYLSNITALNTVTKEQVFEKYNKYQK